MGRRIDARVNIEEYPLHRRWRGFPASTVCIGWVQDGIRCGVGRLKVCLRRIRDLPELGTGRHRRRRSGTYNTLCLLRATDASAALRILRMPFLKTIEPPDASAMESLSRLAISDTGTFRDVLSHPALTDGISNDLAPIVATLHGVAGTNPALIEVLLDPSNRVVLELRTITLPLSGEVVLTIIRTGPGATAPWICWSTRYAAPKRLHGRAAADQLRRPALRERCQWLIRRERISAPTSPSVLNLTIDDGTGKAVYRRPEHRSRGGPLLLVRQRGLD